MTALASGQKAIAVTGTAIALGSSVAVNGVIVTASKVNAAPVFIGGSGVTNTNTGSGNGYVVEPGASVTILVTNINQLYINGTAGDSVSYNGNLDTGKVQPMTVTGNFFPSEQASNLPTASTRATTLFATNGNMAGPGLQLVPSGDWVMGCSFRAVGDYGTILTAGMYTVSANNRIGIVLEPSGVLSMFGTDGSGVGLGSKYLDFYNSSNAIKSKTSIPKGSDVSCVFRKTGNYIELWLLMNGGVPFKSSSEYTSFGAFSGATDAVRVGYSMSGGNNFNGHIRDAFFVTGSFTKTQIEQVLRGLALPQSFVTPASTDFFFPLSAQSNPRQELITGKTGYSAYSVSAGSAIGYAYDQTEAVYLNSVGQSFQVFQFNENGYAGVELSGTYLGTHGTDIQAQIIDEDDKVVVPWRTVDTAATGGVWSGSIDIPKRKKWLRVQLRKVIDGVVSTQIMTAAQPFGVGASVMFTGQSLAQHMRETNPNGLGMNGAQTSTYGLDNTPANGYFSYLQRNGYNSIDGVDAQENLTITGAASAGGLIEITTSVKHGLSAGMPVGILSVTGTTEANGLWDSVTPTSPTKFTIDGSTFANAWISGGTVCINSSVHVRCSTNTYSSAMTLMANAISNIANCVVAISNRAYQGSPLSDFTGFSKQQTLRYMLEAKVMKKIGFMLWLQGHGDAYGSNYFSDAGSLGSWTGWGKLGTLLDFMRTNLSNSNLRLGVVPFTSVEIAPGSTPGGVHSFRLGMDDWIERKRLAGETRVFSGSFMHDFQPVAEGGVAIHLAPTMKGYLGAGARLGHAAGKFAVSNADYKSAKGPTLVSATRSGAVITMTVDHNGGSSLKVPVTGAKASGFEFSTASNFSTLLTASDIQITGTNQITATLSSDPGATVYVRYMWGYVGNWPQGNSGTAIITGVADNGAGLIRVTCGTTSGQITGGLNFATDEWVELQGVGPSALGLLVNKHWQVIPVSTTEFDLKGSTSAGLPAFGAAGDVWRGTGTSKPCVKRELAMPIYDDQLVGTFDASGLPLQPTYTYLTAA